MATSKKQAGKKQTAVKQTKTTARKNTNAGTTGGKKAIGRGRGASAT
jgi:hypothetical protein